MTKTLTKQYKNKELSGWYYVKAKDGSINHWLLFTDSIEFDKDGDVEEVLAPVPSYDIWKNIKEQWKVAMPQIERLQDENKKLKERLADADKTITSMVGNGYCKADDIGQEYIEKWKVEF